MPKLIKPESRRVKIMKEEKKKLTNGAIIRGTLSPNGHAGGFCIGHEKDECDSCEKVRAAEWKGGNPLKSIDGYSYDAKTGMHTFTNTDPETRVYVNGKMTNQKYGNYVKIKQEIEDLTEAADKTRDKELFDLMIRSAPSSSKPKPKSSAFIYWHTLFQVIIMLVLGALLTLCYFRYAYDIHVTGLGDILLRKH